MLRGILAWSRAMPTPNPKNMMGSQAVLDLGLGGMGDALRDQTEARTLELKKKKQGQQNGVQIAPTMLGLEGADYGG
jgi:hypothetical protein